MPPSCVADASSEKPLDPSSPIEIVRLRERYAPKIQTGNTGENVSFLRR